MIKLRSIKRKNNITKTFFFLKKKQICHRYGEKIGENFNCAISIVKLCFLLVYTILGTHAMSRADSVLKESRRTRYSSH